MLSWDGASQSHCSFSSLPLIKVGQRGACRRSVIEIITWLHSCWWKLWNWARLDLSNLKVKVQVCISVHSEGRTQQVRQKRTKKQVDEAASLLFFGGADVLPSLVAIKERESRDSHFYTPFSCTIINNSVIKSVHTHIIWYTLLSLVALDHSGISFLFAPIPQAKPPCNRSQHHRTSSPLFLHPAPRLLGTVDSLSGKSTVSEQKDLSWLRSARGPAGHLPPHRNKPLQLQSTLVTLVIAGRAAPWLTTRSLTTLHRQKSKNVKNGQTLFNNLGLLGESVCSVPRELQTPDKWNLLSEKWCRSLAVNLFWCWASVCMPERSRCKKMFPLHLFIPFGRRGEAAND